MNAPALADTAKGSVDNGAVYVSREERYEVGCRDGWLCAYCAEPVDLDSSHLEHIVPLSAGGPHAAWNCTLACPSCNTSKGASDPVDWLTRLMDRRQLGSIPPKLAVFCSTEMGVSIDFPRPFVDIAPITVNDALDRYLDRLIEHYETEGGGLRGTHPNSQAWVLD